MPLNPATESSWFPDDTGGATIQADAGATVDNIFVYTSAASPTGKVKRVVDGVYRAAWAGILTGVAGSTIATRLNALFADSRINTVVFDKGIITITGTINCQGKKLTFLNGGRLIGTHTLNNGILDCDLKSQCFTTNTTLTNFISARSEISFENFGAVGSGSDETLILQKTADTLISNTSMPRIIKLLCGKSYGTQGLILYNWDGTNYGQFAISLVGEKAAFGGNPAFHPRIIALNPNGFGIGIQRCTGLSIQGIGIQGILNLPEQDPEYVAYYTRAYATWTSGAVRDSAYSPYSLIAIDPFRNTNTLPADNGYPDWNGTTTSLNPTGKNWYRGTGSGGHSGCTAVVIKDCTINGATVGISASVNGETQQAENMSYENCYVGNCKAAFSFGQRESKNCFIRGGYCIDRIHTVLDGTSYGGGLASLPNVIGFNMAGNSVRFVTGVAQHSVVFDNVYSENIYRIGDMVGGAGRVEFRNCNFTFNIGVSNGPLYSQAHFTGVSVSFDTCTMRYYDDLFNKRLNFQGNGIQMKNCYFDQPPIGCTGTGPDGDSQMVSIDLIDCYYGGGAPNKTGWKYLRGRREVDSSGHIPFGIVNIENFGKSSIEVGGTGRLIERYDSGSYEKVFQRYYDGTYVVNSTTHTAVFTAYPYDSPPLDSYILVQISGINPNWKILGRVVSKTNNVCQIGEVPLEFPNGAGTSAGSTGGYGISTVNGGVSSFVGTYTNASFNITNIIGTPTINFPDRYTGWTIKSYDSSTHIAVMSGPAFFSAADVFTPPADVWSKTHYKPYIPYDSGALAESIFYFVGEVWIYQPYNSFYNSSTVLLKPRVFKCVKSGTATTGVWEEIFESKVKDTFVATVDGSIIEPIGRDISGLIIKTSVIMTLNIGTTNGGTEIWSGTTAANASIPIDWGNFFDSDTTIYFTGITGTGGTLIAKFV